MQPRSIEDRLDNLERQMPDLQNVPERISELASQFQRLREEIRNDVSAIRKGFRAADDETRVFMRVLHEDALSRIRAVGEGRDANRQDQ